MYDFGGGTLDVSLLEVVNQGGVWSINVLAHKGANWLGGDDFTKALVKLAADRFAEKKGSPLRYDRDALCDSHAWDDMNEDERMEVYQNWRSCGTPPRK